MCCYCIMLNLVLNYELFHITLNRIRFKIFLFLIKSYILQFQIEELKILLHSVLIKHKIKKKEVIKLKDLRDILNVSFKIIGSVKVLKK